MSFITRFAPSPTGPLHLGHAYSALYAFEQAKRNDGTFLLRIEDIDKTRCRPEWEEQIYDDLTWLGIDWPSPVWRQSDRQSAYDTVLDSLWDEGMLFACDCSRKDIKTAAAQTPDGPIFGPDGIIYPGTCRSKPRPVERPKDVNLRLDLVRAIEFMDFNGHHFFERRDEQKEGLSEYEKLGVAFIIAQETMGDVILARKDIATSYHLSVVLDDADQNITHVIRGKDLFASTWIHVLLQKLLGFKTPYYDHHRLITDENGKRLAKTDKSRALSKFRADGCSPADIREMVGL